MAQGSRHIRYWDSCVFVYYFNSDPHRSPVIKSLLQEVAGSHDHIIVTSVISLVEVAFVSREAGRGALDPSVEANMDALWHDPSVVEVIELTEDIATLGRSLKRQAMQRGWKLTTSDAVHLASAQWLGQVDEFHTYDADLQRFAGLIGCNICEPWILQPKLHD